MVSALSFLFPLSPPPSSYRFSHCVACYFSLFFQPVFLVAFFFFFFSAYILAFYYFTGFSAVQSILCLLPTFTFPPLANLSNSLTHFFSLFIQPIFSTYFLSQFSATFSTLWVSSLTCLYQILHQLPAKMVFQPFTQLFSFFFHSLSLS